MLIAIFMAFTRLSITAIGTLIGVIFHAVMPLVIMCVGIAILCSCVNVRLNFGFVGAIITALINGIGYLGRTCISAIGWVFRHLIMLIPAFHASAKDFFVSFGMSNANANLWAFLATALFIVVLI